MSGLDYSTFSLCSALTPSQPSSTRSYPADPIQQHVAQDVIDSHICNMQREDLPSSSQLSDRSRESYQVQGSSDRSFAFPRPCFASDSADDIQGNILCAQLGEFHFTPQYGGHGHVPVDEPTVIIDNSSWSSQHCLHYPTPVRAFSKCPAPIAVDVRPGLTMPHPDVSPRVPVRRLSMTMSDRQLGTSFDFGLTSSSSSPPLPSMAVDVSTFLPGGMIPSPSPPPTAYHDDDFSGADCAHAFTYAEQLPAMTHEHFPLDCHAAQSLGGFQDAHHQGIISLDPRYATAMATRFPGFSSSQSPHDHPICEPPSFSTAIQVEEFPRPGSAPPLIDSQVPFVGDARAALHAAYSGDHVNRPHPWYSQQPVSGQSPRSSPRRAGSIGHNAQKTPPGSRHLRRWSSVTNPALRASPPFSSSLSPTVAQYPTDNNATNVASHFSPSAESESDDPPYALPHHAAVGNAEPAPCPCPSPPSPSQPSQCQQSLPQQPPMRTVIRCDGHRIDEESWSAALVRPDKQLHVYECFWDLFSAPCGMWIEGDQSSVADHLALFHGFRGGEVTTRCLWRDCPKPHMKGTSIARHVVTHIGFRVKCNTCKHEFARVDACNRAHSRSGCLGVGQPMYGDLQRVLDARKVDPLLRPSKKRRADD